MFYNFTSHPSPPLSGGGLSADIEQDQPPSQVVCESHQPASLQSLMREGGKGGRKEGREGGKEGRKEGRVVCFNLRILHANHSSTSKGLGNEVRLVWQHVQVALTCFILLH